MPLMEDNRMKTLLTGDGAKPLESGALLISNVKIQIFDDQTPPKTQMVIEAPECVFDSRAKNASSTGSIALESTDGRFSIQGVGFNWNQSISSLTISNQVQTFISRKALQSDTAEGAPIQVKADRFVYHKETNLGVYSGHVQAQEGDRFKMDCQRLEAELPEEEDAPQKIIASGDVKIEIEAGGRRTYLNGSEAQYESTGETGNLRLTGNPTWRSDLYSGHGEQIEIRDLNLNPTFSVSGAAAMTLQVSKSTIEADAVQTITLQSSVYELTESGAEFAGDVVASSDAGWNLSSQHLSAAIEKESQSVTKIVAREAVKIQQSIEGKKITASGDLAEFTPDGEALSDALISGNAVVENAEFRSQADQIQLQRQGNDELVRAEGHVSFRIPRASTGQGGFLGLSVRTDTETDVEAGSDGELVITANQYRLADGVGLFEGNVVVKDSDGSLSCRTLRIVFGDTTRTIRSMTASGNVTVVNPEGELSCHELEGQFSGRGNRLVRLVATDAVELRRVNGVATGTRAVFDVVRQEVKLTGEPELRTRIVNGVLTQNVLTTAEELIWDQVSNTFKARGRYRSKTLPNAPVNYER